MLVLLKACRESRPTVKCIVAPYEADAQLAYLCRVGIVHAVVSEDSDTVPYGCAEIITKLEKNGTCLCLSLPDIYRNIGPLDFRSFDQTMVAAMCVAAGCDYASSLAGVGVKKSHKFILRHKTAQRMLRAMRFEGIVPLIEAKWPTGQITNHDKLYQYELDFYKALMTFLHQTVFDPAARRVRPLTDFPLTGEVTADLQPMYDIFRDARRKHFDFSESLSFLGPYIEDNLACEIADGLRDPETMTIFDFNAPLVSPISVVGPCSKSSQLPHFYIETAKSLHVGKENGYSSLSKPLSG